MRIFQCVWVLLTDKRLLLSTYKNVIYDKHFNLDATYPVSILSRSHLIESHFKKKFYLYWIFQESFNIERNYTLFSFARTNLNHMIYFRISFDLAQRWQFLQKNCFSSSMLMLTWPICLYFTGNCSTSYNSTLNSIQTVKF